MRGGRASFGDECEGVPAASHNVGHADVLQAHHFGGGGLVEGAAVPQLPKIVDAPSQHLPSPKISRTCAAVISTVMLHAKGRAQLDCCCIAPFTDPKKIMEENVYAAPLGKP